MKQCRRTTLDFYHRHHPPTVTMIFSLGRDWWPGWCSVPLQPRQQKQNPRTLAFFQLFFSPCPPSTIRKETIQFPNTLLATYSLFRTGCTNRAQRLPQISCTFKGSTKSCLTWRELGQAAVCTPKTEKCIPHNAFLFLYFWLKDH